MTKSKFRLLRKAKDKLVLVLRKAISRRQRYQPQFTVATPNEDDGSHLSSSRSEVFSTASRPSIAYRLPSPLSLPSSSSTFIPYPDPVLDVIWPNPVNVSIPPRMRYLNTRYMLESGEAWRSSSVTSRATISRLSLSSSVTRVPQLHQLRRRRGHSNLAIRSSRRGLNQEVATSSLPFMVDASTQTEDIDVQTTQLGIVERYSANHHRPHPSVSEAVHTQMFTSLPRGHAADDYALTRNNVQASNSVNASGLANSNPSSTVLLSFQGDLSSFGSVEDESDTVDFVVNGIQGMADPFAEGPAQATDPLAETPTTTRRWSDFSSDEFALDNDQPLNARRIGMGRFQLPNGVVLSSIPSASRSGESADSYVSPPHVTPSPPLREVSPPPLPNIRATRISVAESLQNAFVAFRGLTAAFVQVGHAMNDLVDQTQVHSNNAMSNLARAVRAEERAAMTSQMVVELNAEIDHLRNPEYREHAPPSDAPDFDSASGHHLLSRPMSADRSSLVSRGTITEPRSQRIPPGSHGDAQAAFSNAEGNISNIPDMYGGPRPEYTSPKGV